MYLCGGREGLIFSIAVIRTRELFPSIIISDMYNHLLVTAIKCVFVDFITCGVGFNYSHSAS